MPPAEYPNAAVPNKTQLRALRLIVEGGRLYRPSDRRRRWIVREGPGTDRKTQRYVSEQIVAACLAQGWICLLRSEYPQIAALSNTGSRLAKEYAEQAPGDQTPELAVYQSATDAQRKALHLAFRTGALRLWSRNIWVPGDHKTGRPTKSGSVQSNVVRNCVTHGWLTVPRDDTSQTLVTHLTREGYLVALASIAVDDESTADSSGGERKRHAGTGAAHSMHPEIGDVRRYGTPPQTAIQDAERSASSCR